MWVGCTKSLRTKRVFEDNDTALDNWALILADIVYRLE